MCFWASACVGTGATHAPDALITAAAVAPARCLAMNAAGGEAGTVLASPPRTSIAGEHTTVRWASHISRPLRIWIEDASSRPGWDAGDSGRARIAFESWEGTALPIRFAFVDTEGDADIAVRWVDRFSGHYDGWTTVRWDREGWITGGEVRLALHKPNGDPLTPAARQAIATHEVGHVLGLAHASDPTAVMAATVNVTGVTAVDAAAIARLYGAPPIQTAVAPRGTRTRTVGVQTGHVAPCTPEHVE